MRDTFLEIDSKITPPHTTSYCSWSGLPEKLPFINFGSLIKPPVLQFSCISYCFLLTFLQLFSNREYKMSAVVFSIRSLSSSGRFWILTTFHLLYRQLHFSAKYYSFDTFRSVIVIFVSIFLFLSNLYFSLFFRLSVQHFCKTLTITFKLLSFICQKNNCLALHWPICRSFLLLYDPSDVIQFLISSFLADISALIARSFVHFLDCLAN